jgi:hypothetical protein
LARIKKEGATVKGLFLAMTIALTCTAAHAEMPHDHMYYENEVDREYARTMAQCTLDADQYTAEHVAPIEYGSLNALDEIKLRDKTYRRRYGLCMKAAGWPSPFPEDEYNPTAGQGPDYSTAAQRPPSPFDSRRQDT